MTVIWTVTKESQHQFQKFCLDNGLHGVMAQNFPTAIQQSQILFQKFYLDNGLHGVMAQNFPTAIQQSQILKEVHHIWHQNSFMPPK